MLLIAINKHIFITKKSLFCRGPLVFRFLSGLAVGCPMVAGRKIYKIGPGTIKGVKVFVVDFFALFGL